MHLGAATMASSIKDLNFVKIKGNKKMKEYLKPFLFETVAHLIKLRNLVKVNNF